MVHMSGSNSVRNQTQPGWTRHTRATVTPTADELIDARNRAAHIQGLRLDIAVEAIIAAAIQKRRDTDIP